MTGSMTGSRRARPPATTQGHTKTILAKFKQDWLASICKQRRPLNVDRHCFYSQELQLKAVSGTGTNTWWCLSATKIAAMTSMLSIADQYEALAKLLEPQKAKVCDPFDRNTSVFLQ